MPRKEFQKKLQELEEMGLDPGQIIMRLARHFYSSKHAVLVRIERLGLETRNSRVYKSYFDGVKNNDLSACPYRPKPKILDKNQQKRAGDIAKCLNQRGKRFVSMVLESKDKELITLHDVIDYLNLRLDYLDDLNRALHN